MAPSEIAERASVAGAYLFEPELGALERAGDAVEKRGHVVCVRIGVVECAGEQRPRDGPFVHVSALGQAAELLRVHVVERDVDAVRIRRTSHGWNVARADTGRVVPGAQRNAPTVYIVMFMTRTLALAAISLALATVAATAGTRLAAPIPDVSRRCGSRGEGNKPQALPSPIGARIGPLVIWPTIRRTEHYGRDGWAFYTKAPIVVPARARVILAVAPEARRLAGFQSGTAAGWVSSVRFEACRERTPAFAYQGTVGRYTGFPFGFGLARHSLCVPIEVWVDGSDAPIRRLVPFGRRACGQR